MMHYYNTIRKILIYKVLIFRYHFLLPLIDGWKKELYDKKKRGAA